MLGEIGNMVLPWLLLSSCYVCLLLQIGVGLRRLWAILILKHLLVQFRGPCIVGTYRTLRMLLELRLAIRRSVAMVILAPRLLCREETIRIRATHRFKLIVSYLSWVAYEALDSKFVLFQIMALVVVD